MCNAIDAEISTLYSYVIRMLSDSFKQIPIIYLGVLHATGRLALSFELLRYRVQETCISIFCTQFSNSSI